MTEKKISQLTLSAHAVTMNVGDTYTINLLMQQIKR